MGVCFFIILLAAFGVFVMATMIRWFEQTANAFDNREWNKLSLLVLMPFAAWLFPSHVTAGRPAPVLRHEPVRGFGGLPKGGIEPPTAAPSTSSGSAPPPLPKAAGQQPPPGTPPEFLELPKIPPRKPRAPVDPNKLAKLRQKMKEQGMLQDDDSGAGANQT